MNRFLYCVQKGGLPTAGSPFQTMTLSSLGLSSGSDLAVSNGIELFIDVSNPVFGAFSYAAGAKVTFDPNRDITMTATQVMGDGLWQISAADGVGPYTRRARIILTGASETRVARPVDPYTGVNQGFTNAGLSRVISNHGIRFWKGVPKNLPKTRLAAHALTGQNSAVLVGNCADYQVGDEIIIAPTNFAGQSNPERRTLTAVGAYNSGANTTTVTWSSSFPLLEDHWGVLQYPIDAPYGTNSVSLTVGTYTPPDEFTPTVYDARAEVLNISNGNISVEAPNDSEWTNNGFGATIMDHPGSSHYDEGVRVIRGGQRGNLGRYPFHSHRLSYTDVASTVTIDANGALARVNWVGHGITAVTPNLGTVTFGNYNIFGGSLQVNTTGIQSLGYAGMYCTFQAGSGSTLPPNVTPGVVYFMANTSSPNVYVLCTGYTGNINDPAAPRVSYVNSGTGTTNSVDCSVSDQPITFTTTGTLPYGMSTGKLTLSTAQFTDQAGTGVGTKYAVVGSSITPNSFCISIPASGGAGSGVHTATYTRFTQDRPDCRRIKCTVDGSQNRAYTTHASCGVEISDSIAYDIRGQAFFLEDGSEERCKMYRNTMMLVRNPTNVSDRLKLFDGAPDSVGEFQFFQSSGFWLSNPNNDFQGNIGILCDGNGVHNSFGASAFGLSTRVNMKPMLKDILVWKGNGGHSNWKRGVMTNTGVVDEFGHGLGAGIEWTPSSAGALNFMEGGIVWKNRQGGYNNVVQGVGPNYRGWVAADNNGGDFEGATANSVLGARSILFIGYSNLPPATTQIQIDALYERVFPISRFANATYHFTLFFSNCSYHNYPWQRPYYRQLGQKDYGGGAYSWRDMYTVANASQFIFSLNNRYNNTNPGQLSREPRLAGYPVTLTLANPLRVSVNLADTSVVDGQTVNSYEFVVQENEPISLTRTSGAWPAVLAPYNNGAQLLYAKNVKDGAGNLVGVSSVGNDKFGVSFELSLTPGGASLNAAGQTQSGNFAMHPMWRTFNTPTNFGMGSFIPDASGYYGKGSTGSAMRWVCPYGDIPFFAYDAANRISVEPTTSDGLFGLGFSTTDLFHGIADLRNDVIGNAGFGSNHTSGLQVIRYDPANLTTVIGTYNSDALGSQLPFFQDFVHVSVKNRGAYSISSAPSAGIPTVYAAARLTVVNKTGIDQLLGIQFSGSSTATKVWRTLGVNGSGGAPLSAPDGRTGCSVVCTAAAGATEADKFAAMKASSNGSLFWHDKPNNMVWVRWLPLPGNAADDANFNSLSNSEVEKGERSSWYIVQA